MEKTTLRICLSSPAPQSLNPGAYFTLRLGVEGKESGKMEGKYVLLKDEKGETLHRFRLMFLLGGRCDGDLVAFRAPVKAGSYTWTANLEDTEIACPISFTVVDAHKLFLSLWDLPASVKPQQRFSLQGGVKCSAGCALGGKKLRILGEEEELLCEAALEDTPYPGTKALYSAKLGFEAPKDPGLYSYCMEYLEDGSHTELRKEFKLRVCE